MNIKKIAIASDHAGYKLKEYILSIWSELSADIELIDYGPHNTESVDYPDYADTVCLSIKNNITEQGILICHSGIGMSIRANRHEGIRAALCHDTISTNLTRQHNHANVLCLSSLYVSEIMVKEILKVWLNTPNNTDDRHQRRVNKLS